MICSLFINNAIMDYFSIVFLNSSTCKFCKFLNLQLASVSPQQNMSLVILEYADLCSDKDLSQEILQAFGANR